MNYFNRATKKANQLDADFEGWFRSYNTLMAELRYSESLAETRAALNAFKFKMKRSRNRYFVATRLEEYVKTAQFYNE